MGVLQQAASISPTPDSNYEMVEYVISLREGIMDAYDGIIIALKSGDKSESPTIYSVSFSGCFERI